MPTQILQFCHNLNCTGVKIYKWQKRNKLSVLIATTYSKGIIHKSIGKYNGSDQFRELS